MNTKYKYPIRMKSKKSGRIVEFTGLCTGTITQLGCTHHNEKYPVGYQSDNWFEHTDSSRWEYVGSPIWLSQKK